MADKYINNIQPVFTTPQKPIDRPKQLHTMEGPAEEFINEYEGKGKVPTPEESKSSSALPGENLTNEEKDNFSH
ncbi:MAG: hypothetical protein OM95_14225 [Bdellovibrio sp. ArHS]|uniref:hypothetical protein n=1 Tax=Bdellovibrio sp. ArHS TaxID=1569284 RepID=UPI0005823EF4|nr:hypothetical protein [Bdellovibrio sp. ArHS]KHD87447.1 MAG: hypothetical protein OM95_14225 [Bdellovibrio sp. ArHS]